MEKVLVLGFSKSGISAAKFLIQKGVEVYITEYREEKPEDREKIDEVIHSIYGVKLVFHCNAHELLESLGESIPIFGGLYDDHNV